MNQWSSWRGLICAVGMFGVVGCHCCQRPCPPPCAPACAPGPCAPAGAVYPGNPVMPANPSPPVVPALTAPPVAPPQIQNYGPAPAANAPAVGVPAQQQPEPPPAVPAPTAPPPEAPGARLAPPDTGTAGPAQGVTERSSASPPSSWPVGIPQFAFAVERVASGLRPLPGGLEWLAANGYRTVLHVRPAGTNDAAERRQAEQLGLKYLTLDVSPQTLSRPVVDQFSRIVTDQAGLPLYVYDANGTLAGALWYLYFRTAGQLSDEQARAQAARLGLKPDATGEQAAMWLAIQKVLVEPAPR